MKPIKLTPGKWIEIMDEIKLRHPPSVLLSRRKMREVLGFTPREHRERDYSGNHMLSVHLDFFDDAKRTMFLLKYSEFITNGRNQSSDIE